MKVFKPMSLGLLTRPMEHQRRFMLGIAVLSFVPIGDKPALLSEMSLWKFLPEELLPDQAIDAGIPKASAEFLVTGHACARRGTTAAALPVSVRLGTYGKSLHAFGDRYWIGNRPSDPVPFDTVPLDWAHAYGGADNKYNPLGKGIDAVDTAHGKRLPLPNVIDPAEHSNARYRRAAGFGPLHQTWPQRARFAGSYDDIWLKQDFPGFPRDIDWRFFNLAPPDQQIPHAWVGDEAYALENMHQDVPVLTGRLPGVTPRVFVQRRDSEAFEEISLALTTVWFFPHRLRLVMVHHGHAALVEEDGADVARLLVGADRLGHPRDPAEFNAVMRLRLDKERGAINALRDADLVPRDLLVPDPGLEADKALNASENLQQKHGRRRIEREIRAARAAVAEYGLDPDEHGPRLPPPEGPEPTLETLPDMFDQLLQRAEQEKADLASKQAEFDRALEPLLHNAGMTMEQLKAEREAKPAGPPRFTAAGMRGELEGISRACHLLGIDSSDVDGMLADPCRQAMWEQAEAGQRDTYRLTAHMQDPARPKDWERCRQTREALTGEPRSWARADLTGLDLAGLNLAHIDLQDAWLDGTDLHGTDLSHANLRNAVLAHANLEGCRLDGADLTGTNLGRARMRGASLRGAILVEAVLADADMQDVVLHGANLGKANLSGAQLTGMDLTGADAPDLLLMKTSLAGLQASGACLDRIKVLEADLAGANLSQASLNGALFYKTQARGMDAGGSRLRKAVFTEDCDLTEAQFTGADLTGANLRGMRLPRSDFSRSVLDGADFSACDLSDATLHRARARQTRLVGANLARAVLSQADCMNASFARADLRGADLTEASFYEADAARMRTDEQTRATGMLTIRTRVHPRAVP
jgi:uncharacterized protein YjbI with pentapeptide repeats